MNIQRKITMNVRLPVTLELIVNPDTDESGLEDANWSIVSVRPMPGNSWTANEVNEAMDEADLVEVDQLAFAAEDLE